MGLDEPNTWPRIKTDKMQEKKMCYNVINWIPFLNNFSAIINLKSIQSK